jgi:Zn-dependent peptidase ImmA (M78 family)
LSKNVTDERAHDLRRRYHERFEALELPVPVDSIAEDLLGLQIVEIDMECSGMLLPVERRILVNAGEHETRRRFTVAHELGHWICQCLEGSAEPVFCRAQDIETDADRAREREANVFAAELLMPEYAVRELGENAFGVSDLAYRWRLYSFGLGPAPA